MPVNGPRSSSAPDTGAHHEQLSEKVARHVREAIMVGDLRAPGFIRTEKLAEELGVSPTPVREALMILSAEGTVRWEPRKGYRVNSMSPQDVRDLFDVQAYIAGELAFRAAQSLTDEEIEHLISVQKDLEAAAEAGDVERVDVLNHEIHRVINSTSRSHRMATLLRQTVQYVPLGFFGRVQGWTEASTHEHAAIFEALRNRDAEAAQVAMRDHIGHIGELLVQHLQAQGSLE